MSECPEDCNFFTRVNMTHAEPSPGAARLFLEVSTVHGAPSLPLHSAISLFLLSYTECTSVHVHLVSTRAGSARALSGALPRSLPVSELKREDAPPLVRSCRLPAVLEADGRFCRAGLAVVLRCIIQRSCLERHGRRDVASLLGFKGTCLKACAEVSQWTRLCETDIPSAVEEHLLSPTEEGLQVPAAMLHLEHCLAEPVRVHNDDKLRRNKLRQQRNARNVQPGVPGEGGQQVCPTEPQGEDPSAEPRLAQPSEGVELSAALAKLSVDAVPAAATRECSDIRRVKTAELPDLEHVFAEGLYFTLTDVVLLPCVHRYLIEVVGWSLHGPMGRFPIVGVAGPMGRFPIVGVAGPMGRFPIVGVAGPMGRFPIVGVAGPMGRFPIVGVAGPMGRFPIVGVAGPMGRFPIVGSSLAQHAPHTLDRLPLLLRWYARVRELPAIVRAAHDCGMSLSSPQRSRTFSPAPGTPWPGDAQQESPRPSEEHFVGGPRPTLTKLQDFSGLARLCEFGLVHSCLWTLCAVERLARRTMWPDCTADSAHHMRACLKSPVLPVHLQNVPVQLSLCALAVRGASRENGIDAVFSPHPCPSWSLHWETLPSAVSPTEGRVPLSGAGTAPSSGGADSTRPLKVSWVSGTKTVNDPPLISYRCGKDIKDVLVRSKMSASRAVRKQQQLNNLVAMVMELARPGHTIVDFCSGGGHLGIVLAHTLPKCQVILVENKEESLARARERSSQLGLPNVSFIQANLDYFTGPFHVGRRDRRHALLDSSSEDGSFRAQTANRPMSSRFYSVALHACGVATDMVVDCCVQARAGFVVSPCCYGFIQNTLKFNFPRSKKFAETVTCKEHMILCRFADQTAVQLPAERRSIGKRCMGLVDLDRGWAAEAHGYSVRVMTMEPESCSPKNNMLVGILAEKDTAGH
ncbi:hypothetical protein P4O66_013904 [Electrophorus voltai]|uniref:Methyltransferase domain-containing protein n=1 Tax=Electrophorus voltai TaxID=2609070 RepID=A0AAD9DT99_9TELE|nr:hypothetical protein P4O66_013904 [Electrophorus voltai]